LVSIYKIVSVYDLTTDTWRKSDLKEKKRKPNIVLASLSKTNLVALGYNNWVKDVFVIGCVLLEPNVDGP